MISNNILTLVVLLAPLLNLVVFFIPRLAKRFSVTRIKPLTTVVSLYALVVSVVAIIAVITNGNIQKILWEYNGLGFSVRLDGVSLSMFTMIALLAVVIVKFSANYLDGDSRQHIFTGQLAGTIAMVQLLVLSGNLLMLFIAWVGTSLVLHKLLLFYPERRRAQVAARKKYIVARLADAFLLAAIVLLYMQYKTGNLDIIFTIIQNNEVPVMQSTWLAAILLVFAALLKSAQFPLHGWLVEVMESPTPVSALLHAGVLNAGPFLMIRMAYVINTGNVAPMLLITAGGFTAFFASVVFIMQPSVKTTLGYSSMAHMGFSLMVCGLGVYPAAMLHLVAHSFYKAHAFLSSGSTIDLVKEAKINMPERKGNPLRIIVAIALALLVFVGISWLWGVRINEHLALMAIGFIIVMGLAQLLAPAIDSRGFLQTAIQTLLLTILVAVAFFTLEGIFHKILMSQVPQMVQPKIFTILIIAFIFTLFGVTIMLQMLSPVLKQNSLWYRLSVHFRNGWYINAYFDKRIGAYKQKKFNSTKKPVIAHYQFKNR